MRKANGPRAGKIHRNGLPLATLRHLAENGPTEKGELLEFMRSQGRSTWAVGEAMDRMKAAGFIKTKVWLTPEGLRALREAEQRQPRDVTPDSSQAVAEKQ